MKIKDMKTCSVLLYVLPCIHHKTRRSMIQSDRLNIMLNTDLGRKIFVHYRIPVPTVIQMLMNLFPQTQI